MKKFELNIEKLHIQNFRQFEDIEITFDEKLTIFIAENGGGKTSVLDCLKGMLSYAVYQIRQSPEKDPFIKTDIRWQQTNFQNELSFKKETVISDDDEHISLDTVSVDFSLRQLQSRFVMEDEKGIFPELYQNARFGDANLPIIAYYPCYLAAMQPFSNGRVKEENYSFLEIFDAYDHALDQEVLDFKRLKKWLIWKYLQEQESGNGIFDFIRQALIGENGILNDTDNRAFFDLKVTYQDNPTGDFVFIKGTTHLLESQLSSGEWNLMMLVADIARRLVMLTPLSKNPLKDGSGLVLIDEIDLHLHPSWQRRVVPKLMMLFPNVQFVVTTHSPMILSNVYSKHIRVISDKKIYGVRDTFGHDDADDMLEIMGVKSEIRSRIKEIHRLLSRNKIVEAKEIRNRIVTEGTFAPLLEIDLFIQRKERMLYETH